MLYKGTVSVVALLFYVPDSIRNWPINVQTFTTSLRLRLWWLLLSSAVSGAGKCQLSRLFLSVRSIRTMASPSTGEIVVVFFSESQLRYKFNRRSHLVGTPFPCFATFCGPGSQSVSVNTAQSAHGKCLSS
jgi:hypothetical protein